MIRRPPRSTLSSSSAASDVYKRQLYTDICYQCTACSVGQSYPEALIIYIGCTDISLGLNLFRHFQKKPGLDNCITPPAEIIRTEKIILPAHSEVLVRRTSYFSCSLCQLICRKTKAVFRIEQVSPKSQIRNKNAATEIIIKPGFIRVCKIYLCLVNLVVIACKGKS